MEEAGHIYICFVRQLVGEGDISAKSECRRIRCCLAMYECFGRCETRKKSPWGNSTPNSSHPIPNSLPISIEMQANHEPETMLGTQCIILFSIISGIHNHHKYIRPSPTSILYHQTPLPPSSQNNKLSRNLLTTLLHIDLPPPPIHPCPPP